MSLGNENVELSSRRLALSSSLNIQNRGPHCMWRLSESILLSQNIGEPSARHYARHYAIVIPFPSLSVAHLSPREPCSCLISHPLPSFVPRSDTLGVIGIPRR